MNKGSNGIDPAESVAALLGNECFICGKVILGRQATGWYGTAGLELPLHISCADGMDTHQVAVEYHRRVSDLANMRRFH